jgi:hypothetical protein
MILGVIFRVHLVKVMTVIVCLWVGLAKSMTGALFSSGDSSGDSTMQKEDSPSHQNVDTCIEY